MIPPAWRDVWICRWPNGHLQAVGTDDAGRRQYLYHPDWRTQRDAAKHARVLEFGRVLSKAREQVLVDLGTEGMSQDRACAVAVRLLDLGYFRIGNDVYAEENGSFGLTTLQRQHVRKQGSTMVFCFVGKSGIEHCITIDDPADRRGAGGDAAAARAGRRGAARLEGAAAAGTTSTPGHVNDYVRRTTGAGRDRQGLPDLARDRDRRRLAGRDATSPGDTKASRKRAEVAAMKEVAEFLGNTPALARSSYVDPRVVDAYEEGTHDRRRRRRKAATPDERQTILERAVLRLLKEA